MFKPITKLIILAVCVLWVAGNAAALEDDIPELRVGATIRVTLLPAITADDLSVAEKETLAPEPEDLAAARPRSAEMASPKQVEGKLLGVSKTSITLEIPGGIIPVVVARENIAKLEVVAGKKSRGTNALKGFVVGAVAGGLVGISGGDDPPGMFSMTAEGKAAFGAVTLGMMGSLIGVLSSPGDKWQTVPADKIQLGFNLDARGGTGVFLCATF